MNRRTLLQGGLATTVIVAVGLPKSLDVPLKKSEVIWHIHTDQPFLGYGNEVRVWYYDAILGNGPPIPKEHRGEHLHSGSTTRPAEAARQWYRRTKQRIDPDADTDIRARCPWCFWKDDS